MPEFIASGAGTTSGTRDAPLWGSRTGDPLEGFWFLTFDLLSTSVESNITRLPTAYWDKEGTGNLIEVPPTELPRAFPGAEGFFPSESNSSAVLFHRNAAVVG